MQIRWKGLGLLILSCCFICSVFAQDNDYVVATLGDEEIYFSEIERASEGLNRFLKENFEMSLDWRMNYIRNYVTVYVLSQRAIKEGLNKEKDVMFDLENARRKILSEKILQNSIEGKEITEDEIKGYYEKNQEKYQIKEKIKVTYIKTKDKADAGKIAEKLNKGKSFNHIWWKKKIKVKQSLSRDSAYIEQEKIGGFTVPDEVFDLGVGGSSGSLEINEEYYIFRVDEKEPAQMRPYDEVRGQVVNDYSRDRRDFIVNSLVNETFEQQNVTIYNKTIREEFEAAQPEKEETEEEVE
jgi:hypothetical protein